MKISNVLSTAATVLTALITTYGRNRVSRQIEDVRHSMAYIKAMLRAIGAPDEVLEGIDEGSLEALTDWEYSMSKDLEAGGLRAVFAPELYQLRLMKPSNFMAELERRVERTAERVAERERIDEIIDRTVGEEAKTRWNHLVWGL